jgi:hypothetical protein
VDLLFCQVRYEGITNQSLFVMQVFFKQPGTFPAQNPFYPEIKSIHDCLRSAGQTI